MYTSVLSRFLGKGLLTLVDYETWKPRRQLYDPSFRKRLLLQVTNYYTIGKCAINRLILMFCSYLKTLLTPFNEMADRFLEQIKPLADGATLVPMKRHFGELTMDAISKVGHVIGNPLPLNFHRLLEIILLL